MSISKKNFWVSAAFYGIISFCVVCFCTLSIEIIVLGVKNSYVWGAFILLALDILLGILAYRSFRRAKAKIEDYTIEDVPVKIKLSSGKYKEEMN